MSAQAVAVNAAFDALDTNHDGVISRAEFAAVAGGGSAQMGDSVNLGGPVQMVGATVPGTATMVGAGVAPGVVTYGTGSVTYGAPGQPMTGMSMMGGQTILQGHPGTVMMGGEQQIIGGTMVSGESMATGTPGMQIMAEPVVTGVQMPMGMSMPTMSMPASVPTMTTSPVMSMTTQVGSGGQGAFISNMPVYAAPTMERQTAPTVYAAPQVGQSAVSTTAAPVYTQMQQVGGTTVVGGAVQQEGFLPHAMYTVGSALGLGGSQACPGGTYSAPEVTTAPITYAGPPTTVVAPPVYQQPITTAMVPPTTATSIAPPVYVEVAPAIEIQERIVEVPQVEVREVEKQVMVPQIQEIVKEVPRIEIQTVEKIVEVPQIQYKERIVEVPHIETREVIKHVPKVEIQEVVKEVKKIQIQSVEKIVEVPQVQYSERIVEVPDIQIQEVIKHVPRVQVQEVVKEVKRTKVQTIEKIVEVPQVQTVERIVEVPQIQVQEVVKEVPKITVQEKVVEVPKMVEVPQMVPPVQQYGAPQPVMTSSQAVGSSQAPVLVAPPVYMTSPVQMTSSMTVQEPSHAVGSLQAPVMTAPPVYMTSPTQMTSSMTVQEQPAMPSVQYSMAPQTMVGTAMVAEPVTTGMVIEQQPVPMRMEAMPAMTYGAPSTTTYVAGAQPGVMVGGTTVVGGAVHALEEGLGGFLQHAMHAVGNAVGLGGSQATTTYVQGGGVIMASAPAGGVTSFSSVQSAAPVTYGAPGTVTTMSTGGFPGGGGAGSASLFDQLDTNHDGVISREEFAQAVQQ